MEDAVKSTWCGGTGHYVRHTQIEYFVEHPRYKVDKQLNAQELPRLERGEHVDETATGLVQQEQARLPGTRVLRQDLAHCPYSPTEKNWKVCLSGDSEENGHDENVIIIIEGLEVGIQEV